MLRASCNYDHSKAMQLLHARESESLPAYISGIGGPDEKDPNAALGTQAPVMASPNMPPEPPSLGHDV